MGSVSFFVSIYVMVAEYPEYKLEVKNILDKSVLVLGRSGSGKSTIVRDILKTLNGHIDQAVVVNPTIDDNDGYTGIVPRACIHKSLSEELLQSIWDRQEALCAKYKEVNRPHIIASLYERSKSDRSERTIARVRARMQEDIDAVSDDARAAENIKKLCEEFILSVKKNEIARAAPRISSSLTADERETIKHLSLNPRLALIFDDCTSEIEEHKKSKMLREIFYAGRHKMITLIIIVHDDGALKPAVKKSSACIIFTDSKSANSFFTRQNNGFSAEERKKYNRAASDIISPPDKQYQKMVFLQDRGVALSFTARRHDPFRIGAQIIWDYCEAVERHSGGKRVNNKYMARIDNL